jgi:hypothetical protein
VDRDRKRLYVTDYLADQVRALRLDGSPDPSFNGGSLSVDVPFQVTVDCFDGSLIVVPRAAGPVSLTKWDAQGNALWPSPPTLPGGLRSACVDEFGNLFVSTDLDGIRILDKDGAPRAVLDGTGVPGGFNAPTGLWARDLELYVADTTVNRVLRFLRSAPGAYSFTFDQAVTLGINPYGLARDGAGRFHLSSEGYNGFGVFDQAFAPLTSWCAAAAAAYGIDLDADGNVYVAGSNPGNLAKVSSCFPQPPPSACPSAYRGTSPPSAGEGFLFPSPVRGDSARLSYRMSGPGRVECRVWNANGELAARVEERKPQGVQTTPLDLGGFANGLYFYSVTIHYDSGGTERIPTGKFAVIR